MCAQILFQLEGAGVQAVVDALLRDQVLMRAALDDAAVVERGTHQDLIAQKGVYYRLYTGAFELE